MAQHTIIENIHRNTEDWFAVKAAVRGKGVDCPDDTPTVDVAGKIAEIEAGATLESELEINDGHLVSGNTQVNGQLELIIPDTVTTIGYGAFLKKCYAVTAISFPDTLTGIGDNAFYYCSCLQSLDLSNVQTIGYQAFQSCYSLVSLLVSDTLTSIGDYAFNSCYSLVSLDLSNTHITSIGTGTFAECKSLTSLLLPDTLTSIGNGAFSACCVATLDLSNTQVTSIGSSAFSESRMTSVILPNTLMSIGSSVFYSCGRLASIVLPDSVVSIGTNAFYNCRALTDIYYTGTQAQWESITGLSDAGIPSGATIHYEYIPV